MKAFSRNQDFQTNLIDIPEPNICHDDDIKIKVQYVTLCRDDMRIYDKLNVFNTVGVIGHEASGIITDCGVYAKYKGFAIGDRVMLFPISSCGECTSCLKQLPQYCPEVHLASGVLAEYVIRKPYQLIKIPAYLSFPQANLMEPIGDILEALSKIKIDMFSKVLIIGTGFMGLAFTRILKAQGINHITSIEPNKERRALALEFGCHDVFLPSDKNLQLRLMQSTQFQGYDVIIDTSAKAEMLNRTLPCISIGGTLLLFAYHDSTDKLSFNSLNMYVKNLRIVWSCFCGIESATAACDLIHRLSLEKLITAEYPFSECKLAYQKYLGIDEIKVGIQL